jgi:CO/xanthine dehydrogenase Mo-binding subunit
MGAEFAGDGEFKVETDSAAALNAPIVYWMPNWVGAEVEVDTQTGKITVLKLVSMADAGKALVPEAVRGQIEGASMQGLGQTLFEQLVFDGARLVTSTPQQYRVPMMSDVPAAFESITLEQGLARGPLGAKGVGEAGILGIASAIANAVEDAVGVRITSLPLSPDKVLAGLQAKGAVKAI